MVFVVFFIEMVWVIVVLLGGGDCLSMFVNVLVWEVVCCFVLWIGDKYCLGVGMVVGKEVWVLFCDILFIDCVCVWGCLGLLIFLFVDLFVWEFVGDLSCFGFKLI